jgi:hypothetical protein
MAASVAARIGGVSIMNNSYACEACSINAARFDEMNDLTTSGLAPVFLKYFLTNEFIRLIMPTISYLPTSAPY